MMKNFRSSAFQHIEFTHAFQPVIDIDKREVVSYEVLLRGKNNELPDAVFSKVDDKDLMYFDQASREKALRLAKKLGVNCAVSLNFSSGDILFENGLLVEAIQDIAVELGFTSKQITVEITEKDFISELDLLSSTLDRLRRRAIKISIDDFGMGYSGLSMLAKIQPDILKLDISLLHDIDRKGASQSIVKAIVEVCLDLAIEILAEGVETQSELDFLRATGISLYQGYLFAKPGFECLPKVYIPE
ncbi:MAG: EAL domain-containing protein [Pseudomonadales bacterium]